MGKGIATSMIIRPARRGRRSPRPDGGPAPLGIHLGAPISASTPHRRLGKDISGDLILSPVRVNASVRRTWVPGAQTAAQVPDHVAGSNVPARDTGGHYADARRSRVARGGRPSCGVDLG